MAKTKYRPISFLKKHGDMEWLAEQKCPRCRTRGRMIFGARGLRERIRCLECGYLFKIRGRKVA